VKQSSQVLVRFTGKSKEDNKSGHHWPHVIGLADLMAVINSMKSGPVRHRGQMGHF